MYWYMQGVSGFLGLDRVKLRTIETSSSLGKERWPEMVSAVCTIQYCEMW